MSKDGTTHSHEELTSLLDQLFVANLNDEEHGRLMAAAVADQALMRRYLEIVHLREGLPYLLSQPGSVSDQEGALAGSEPEEVLVSRAPCPNLQDRASREEASMFVLGRWWQALAVAACLSFVLGAAATSFVSRWGGWPSRPGGNDLPGRVQAVTSSPMLSFAQDHRLGKITGLSPEAAAAGMLTSMQVGRDLRRGEVVQFSRGFVRVGLESGSQVIVEGPAEFSLVGHQSIFVRVGRVTATSNSGELVLQSPLVTAEFRGSEVMFVSEEDTAADVYVEEGFATLYSTSQEKVASEKLRTLQSHSGVTAHATNNRQLSVLPSGPPANMVASWEEVESRLTKYQQLVLGDRPLAYWPLGHVLRSRRVLDLSQNGFDGLAIGNWPIEATPEMEIEPGTYFNGESYIEPDRKPPLDLQKGFTVEAWAKVAGSSEYQSLFTSRWVFDSNNPQQQCFGFTLYAGDDDYWQFWTGSGQMGEPWNYLKSTTPVNKDRWTHVVATFVPTGNRGDDIVEGKVYIYVDGEQIAEGVHEMSLANFEWPARIGAAEFVPQYLTAWLFKGYMRDVAVYNYPLEVPRIQAHHRMGQFLDDQRLSQRGKHYGLTSQGMMEI